ncbi:MAG: DUF3093 domain-containing protein [Nocardioidaceae bacterium]
MPGDGPDEYDETLYAPLAWWLAVAAFAVVVWWVFVLATPMPVAVGAAVVAAVGPGLGLWSYGRVRVGVRDDAVYAGRAVIELAYCGDAIALDPERTAAVRGRDADARAFLMIRPYIASAVRLHVADERDPTPYWLVSSRHPDRLAAAITAARTRNGTDST